MARTPEQEREYKRRYRAKQRERAAAGQSDAGSDNVASIGAARTARAVEFTVFESVEDAVREEIKSLPMAASRPTEVSAALRLAQILDDKAAAGRVQAAEKLRVTMDALRGGGSSAVNPLKRLEQRRTSG